MKKVLSILILSFCGFMVLSAQQIPDGWYVLESAVNRNYCIDLDHSNAQNGTNIHCWEKNGGNAQRWWVQNRNGGIMFISAVNINYCIDLHHSGAYNGNNIWCYANNNGNAQLWYTEYSNGAWIIRSGIDSRFVIDLLNCRAECGNNIQCWEWHESDAQRWYFVPVGDLITNTPNTTNQQQPNQSGLCTFCHGITIVACSRCGGNGQVFDPVIGTWRTCNLCQGVGHNPCPACGGSGRAR